MCSERLGSDAGVRADFFKGERERNASVTQSAMTVKDDGNDDSQRRSTFRDENDG